MGRLRHQIPRTIFTIGCIIVAICSLLNLLSQPFSTIHYKFQPKDLETPITATLLETRSNATLSIQQSMHVAWQDLIQRDCSNEPAKGCVHKFTNLNNKTTITNSSMITLATHATISKIDRIETQTKWWGGPVSAAIYLNNQKDIDKLFQFLEKTNHGDSTQNITIHALMEHAEEQGYPHNKLRNLALDSVTTDYALPLDADFITNFNAHDKLFDLIHRDSGLRKKLHSKYMFALPPFDVLPGSDNQDLATEDMLPKTKEELVQRVQNKTVVQFYAKNNPGTDRFHEYGEWYQDDKEGSNYYHVIRRFGMEPYVLAYRHGLPPYYEEFRGWGSDKVSWFFHLGKILGYKFGVLRDFYVAHLHHPILEAPMKKKWKKRNERIYIRYQKKLLRNQSATIS